MSIGAESRRFSQDGNPPVQDRNTGIRCFGTIPAMAEARSEAKSIFIFYLSATIGCRN